MSSASVIPDVEISLSIMVRGRREVEISVFAGGDVSDGLVLLFVEGVSPAKGIEGGNVELAGINRGTIASESLPIMPCHAFVQTSPSPAIWLAV